MSEQSSLRGAIATLTAAGRLACALGIATLSAVRVDAQGPPSYVSPEVSADRRVTLRYRAPNAKSVVAAGELDGKPHPLTRDENGVWSVTIGPLAPDINTYSFNVDGVTSLDPLNANTKYGYGRFGAVSIVQVLVTGRSSTTSSRCRTARCESVRICRRHWGSAGRCGSTRRLATIAAATSPSSSCCTAPATSNRVGR